MPAIGEGQSLAHLLRHALEEVLDAAPEGVQAQGNPSDLQGAGGKLGKLGMRFLQQCFDLRQRGELFPRTSPMNRLTSSSVIE